MIQRKNKVLASVMASVLLMGNTVPALAADISVTGDTTGQTPTEFAVDEEALGGGLIVTIPASLELVRDTGTGDYGVEDVVSAQGNMNPSKKLQVSTDLTVEYTNADDNNITLTGDVTFGTNGVEEWTAAQTKASLETLDSRAINVAVSGSDVEYMGTYQTVVEFDINLVSAAGVSSVESYTWTNDGVSATVTGLADGVNGTDLVIPDTYNGLPVTTIGDSAFENTTATSVTMSNNITTLGSRSFYGATQLKRVILSDYLTNIGSNVYAGCDKLTEIVYKGETYTSADALIKALRANGATVADDAFANTKLAQADEQAAVQAAMFTWETSETEASVTGIADGVTETDLVIPSTYNGLPVTTIKGTAFEEENLTSLVIPSSVTSIGQNAFKNSTGLTNIELPDSVTSLGTSAFYGSSIETIKLSENLATIDKNTFYGSKLRSITIPSSVTLINDSAFTECYDLAEVNLSEGLITIRSYAFSNCTSLTSITIPSTVTTIGTQRSFQNSGLTSVTYNGVTYTTDSEIRNAMGTSGVDVDTTTFYGTPLKEGN